MEQERRENISHHASVLIGSIPPPPPPLLSIMSVMWHFLPALEVYTLISRPTFNYMTPWPKANGRVVG